MLVYRSRITLRYFPPCFNFCYFRLTTAALSYLTSFPALFLNKVKTRGMYEETSVPENKEQFSASLLHLAVIECSRNKLNFQARCCGMLAGYADTAACSNSLAQ